MKPWLIFIRERFEPVSHTVLILSFFLSNAFMAYYIRGAGRFAWKFDYIPAFIVTFVMFFHLRLFDEIKDYDLDKRIHPERPLARGLIDLSRFKRSAFMVVGAETLFAAIFLKEAAFLSALIMIGYSLLMYREFFMGKLLWKVLILYVFSHTVISGLMCLFIASVVTDKPLWALDRPYFYIAGISWMNFNIYEFARKTFSREEELPGVLSYTKILKPWGAISLVMLALALAILFVYLASAHWPNGRAAFGAFMVLALILALSALPFLIRSSKRFSVLYRSVATGYLVLNGVVMAVILY